MRYFRLIILLFLVLWSYSAINQTLDVSISTHSYIQEDMKNIIKAAIEQALPDAKNIQFIRMNSENLMDQSVKSNFIYAFDTESEIGPHRIEIEGSAVLTKMLVESGANAWSLDKIEIGGETIEFQEPVIIEVER